MELQSDDTSSIYICKYEQGNRARIAGVTASLYQLLILNTYSE